MLSISTPMRGAGKGNYYLGLAQEDYYTKGGEAPGQWYGKGAAILGVAGEVKEGDLCQILEGYDPKNGAKLVQNAGDPDRQSGWDLTFSAPKSVSTLWAVAADPEIREAIQRAHREAVKSALDYLQEEAGFTRRGGGGAQIERADLIFATFEHGTSRAQDPQIHTHALLMNAALRGDGTTGTVLSKPVFEQKMAAGALYRVELAYQLNRNLNLEVVREKSWFKIDGVPKSLEDEFSKRRKQIEVSLKEGGYSGPIAAKTAALNTRAAKEHLPRELLFNEWQKVGLSQGFGADKLAQLTSKKSLECHPEAGLSKMLEEVTNRISDKESYFSRTSFLRHAAEESQGVGVSASELRKQVSDYLGSSKQIVHLGARQHSSYYTTKEILELESRIIQTAHSRAGESSAVCPGSLRESLARKPSLEKEQREAVLRITTGRGGTQIVTGFAGTGKSFMLEAAKEAFEKDGFKVYGTAPSGVAAQGLEDGTGIKSSTIHRTLHSIKDGELNLDSKSVLIVDEAGMVSTRLMAKLFEETNKRGAKLVLIGDERQIQSVQAGGALRSLKEEIGYSELTSIRRQREDWAKQAVKSFAHGKADKALKAYNDKGLVTVKENPEAAREALISNWKQKGISNPQDNLIIATTNLDVLILNEKAQAVRHSNGMLSGGGLTYKGKTFFEGDRLLFSRNSQRFGVKNGNIGTITKIDSTNLKITAQLDSGKSVLLDLVKYDYLSLGYAITAHKSQGGTYENAHLFVSSHDHKEIAYVKASRVRSDAHFYMDSDTAGENLSAVSRQLQKSKMKHFALSLTGDGLKNSLGIGFEK